MDTSMAAPNSALSLDATDTFPMDTNLKFLLKMESPILAFPKSPGSFELLVANLGQITIQNECKNRYAASFCFAVLLNQTLFFSVCSVICFFHHLVTFFFNGVNTFCLVSLRATYTKTLLLT